MYEVEVLAVERVGLMSGKNTIKRMVNEYLVKLDASTTEVVSVENQMIMYPYNNYGRPYSYTDQNDYSFLATITTRKISPTGQRF